MKNVIFLLALNIILGNSSFCQSSEPNEILISRNQVPLRDTMIELNSLMKSNRILDRNGNVVLTDYFVGAFSDNLASIKNVKGDGKYGFINRNGVLVVPMIYDFVFDFSEELCAVNKENKWFYINKNNEIKINIPEITNPQPFQEGYAKITLPAGNTMIDSTGQMLFEPGTYKNCRSFFEGRALVESNEGKDGFIDMKGRLIIPILYESGSIFSEGLTSVKYKGKWGFIDKDGKTIIDFRYDGADNFILNLARVQLGTKSGYINKIGQIEIPITYDYAEPFGFREPNLAVVGNNGETAFYIDSTGNKVKSAGFVVRLF